MREVLSVFYRLDRRRQGKITLPPLDVYGSVCPGHDSCAMHLVALVFRLSSLLCLETVLSCSCAFAGL